MRVTAELIATRRAGAFQHLTFVAPGVGETARPGHLVSFAVGGPTSSLLARRTLPLHAVTASGTYGGTVEVVVEGARDAGLRWLADLRVHDEVAMIAPLGRPFPLPEQPLPCVVVGVDASTAPLIWLAKQLRDRSCPVELVVAGSDDRHLFGVVEARRIIGGVTVVAADPEGIDRPLAAAVDAAVLRSEAAVVYAAGRAAQMAVVTESAMANGAVPQVCVTEDMPCGTGLCSTCALPVTGRDGLVRTVRSCTEGPVLRGDRVAWDQYLAGLR